MQIKTPHPILAGKPKVDGVSGESGFVKEQSLFELLTSSF
jgi:hypothetical protein